MLNTLPCAGQSCRMKNFPASNVSHVPTEEHSELTMLWGLYYGRQMHMGHVRMVMGDSLCVPDSPQEPHGSCFLPTPPHPRLSPSLSVSLSLMLEACSQPLLSIKTQLKHEPLLSQPSLISAAAHANPLLSRK